MTEKLVGKVNYFHDPDLITYGNTGANFYDTSNHSKRGPITGTINDCILMLVEMITSGYGILFVVISSIIYLFLTTMFHQFQNIMYYSEYTKMITGIFGPIQTNIFWVFILWFAFLFLLNKLFNRQFQTAMRDWGFNIVYPLTACWRMIHKRNGDMTALVEGPQNKTFRCNNI